MKTIKTYLTTIAALLCSLTASAHDFSVGGIYYNITSSTDLTVAVTYRGSCYECYFYEYNGAVTIPEAVTYNSKTYRVTSIEGNAFWNSSRLTSITIPESVTSIGDDAFIGCRGLTSVTILEGVTEIGSYAFYGCSSLASITIPESVTSIGDGAFGGCNSLTSITIPESVTSIGDDAFVECSSLTSVTILEGVTSIGDDAFVECSSLTSITIPKSVTEIGTWVFDGCTSLREVIIEDGRRTLSMGASSSGHGLFYDCPLEKVYLGRNLSYPSWISTTSEGYSPFCNISELTSVIIGPEVTRIGDYAFRNCSNLATITCYAMTPPKCYDGSESCPFYNVNKTIPVYVPQGAISTYKDSDCWYEFTNYIGIDTSIENVVSTDYGEKSTDIHDLSGRKIVVDDLRELEKGTYIINGRKVAVK